VIILNFLIKALSDLNGEVSEQRLHLLSFHEQIAPFDFIVKERFGDTRILCVKAAHSLYVDHLSHLFSNKEFLNFRLLSELAQIVRLIIGEKSVVVEGELGHGSFKNFRYIGSVVWFFRGSRLFQLYL